MLRLRRRFRGTRRRYPCRSLTKTLAEPVGITVGSFSLNHRKASSTPVFAVLRALMCSRLRTADLCDDRGRTFSLWAGRRVAHGEGALDAAGLRELLQRSSGGV